jgi:hypothetical protein
MGQIYVIVNEKNGKAYVGQTINTFEKRYGGAWWKRTTNSHLKKSAQKYGRECFSVWILENGIETFEELNKLEELWAIELNAYAPIGYNLRGCGDNKEIFVSHTLPEYWKEKMRDERGKTVICSDGRVFRSAREAARELRMNQKTMFDLIHGKLKHLRGLTFAYEGTPLPSPPESVRDTSVVPITCSNGKVYPSCSAASRALNIDVASIARCCHGLQGYAEGLTFAFEGDPLPTYNGRTSGKPKKKIIVGDRTYDSMKEASVATGVSMSSISKAIENHCAAKGLIFEEARAV